MLTSCVNLLLGLVGGAPFPFVLVLFRIGNCHQLLGLHEPTMLLSRSTFLLTFKQPLLLGFGIRALGAPGYNLWCRDCF